MNKKTIREIIKEKKRNISKQDKIYRSENVLKKIENDLDFIKAKKILAYWSMDDEVFTHNFIDKWCAKKAFYLPVVVGDSLELRQYLGSTNLSKDNNFGIGEPNGTPFYDIEEIEYAIIPGIAFDIFGNRLGRGRGFYDRLLPSLKAVKVGVCFNFQYLNEIPFDKHDVKMDKVFFEDK